MAKFTNNNQIEKTMKTKVRILNAYQVEYEDGQIIVVKFFRYKDTPGWWGRVKVNGNFVDWTKDAPNKSVALFFADKHKDMADKYTGQILRGLT
jgi:hypothetical protein